MPRPLSCRATLVARDRHRWRWPTRCRSAGVWSRRVLKQIGETRRSPLLPRRPRGRRLRRPPESSSRCHGPAESEGPSTAMNRGCHATRTGDPSTHRPRCWTWRGTPQRFINREISWLHFNRRVLEEAENRNAPPAGATALPLHLRQQPRRVLHGPRGGPDRTGARGRRRLEPRRPYPAEQLTTALPAPPKLHRRPAAPLARTAGDLAGVGIVLVDGTRSPPTKGLARPLPEHVLPVADARWPSTRRTRSRSSPTRLHHLRSSWCAQRRRDMNALIPFPPQVDRFIRLPTAGTGACASSRWKTCSALFISAAVPRL